MTNDQFLFFPMLSYSYKNTVGAVARLFFSDPPLTPHATREHEFVSYYLIGKIFAGTFISSQGGSGLTQYCGQWLVEIC